MADFNKIITIISLCQFKTEWIRHCDSLVQKKIQWEIKQLEQFSCEARFQNMSNEENGELN